MTERWLSALKSDVAKVRTVVSQRRTIATARRTASWSDAEMKLAGPRHQYGAAAAAAAESALSDTVSNGALADLQREQWAQPAGS